MLVRIVLLSTCMVRFECTGEAFKNRMLNPRVGCGIGRQLPQGITGPGPPGNHTGGTEKSGSITPLSGITEKSGSITSLSGENREVRVDHVVVGHNGEAWNDHVVIGHDGKIGVNASVVLCAVKIVIHIEGVNIRHLVHFM